MKNFLLFNLLILMFCASCAGYHNKIRKQSVANKVVTTIKKEKDQQIIEISKNESNTESTELVAQRFEEERLDELPKNNTIVDEVSGIPQTNTKIDDIPKVHQPADTIYLEESPVEEALSAQKDSTTAMILFILSLVLGLFFLGWIPYLFALAPLRRAKQARYNTPEGARRLEAAKVLFIIKTVLLVIKFLFFFIILLLLLGY